jgi:ankyrin repeat protein
MNNSFLRIIGILNLIGQREFLKIGEEDMIQRKNKYLKNFIMIIRDIVKAIEGNQNELLKAIISVEEIESVVDEYGDPLLVKALHCKNINALEILIPLVNVNLKDSKGQTVLHHCGYYGNYPIALDVLNIGGDLSICDEFGNQPLWTAVFNVKKDLRGLDVVELYLKWGANKYHKNDAGKSPLDFALQVNFAPLLEVLNKYN